MNHVKSYLLLFSLFFATSVGIQAESYLIDTTGGHASVNFRIKHLGYSWLAGRFDKFKGTFNFDEKYPSKSSIQMSVSTASINTAHGLRDSRLRGKKYLHTRRFPTATFNSDTYKPLSKTTGVLIGKLNLHGITRPVSMTVKQVGAGDDPWGGFRRGFETSFTIRLNDFGIKHDLGKASEELQLTIYIEGVKDSDSFGSIFEN